MEFDELIGALFGLYILLSILSGVLRGVRGRGPGPGREAGPEVLDMEELERRLREAQVLEQEEAPRPGRRAAGNSTGARPRAFRGPARLGAPSRGARGAHAGTGPHDAAPAVGGPLDAAARLGVGGRG